MIDERLKNLYQTKLYQTESRLTDKFSAYNELETIFALANLIYVESNKCFRLTNEEQYKTTIAITDPNNQYIKSILESDNKDKVMHLLFDLQDYQEKAPNSVSSLDLCIMVCEKYQEELKTR